MKLDQFAFIDNNVFKNSLFLFENFNQWINLKEKINEVFKDNYDEDKNIFYFNENYDKTKEDNANHVWFNTGLIGKNSPNIWLKFEKNKRPNAQEWFGKKFNTQNKMIKEILKNKFFLIGDIIIKDYSSFLKKLKEKAQLEEWEYKNYTQSRVDYPILKSYIEHTFKKLKQENKIEESNDDECILFNTGLLSRKFLLDIYIKCQKKKIKICDIKNDFYKSPEIVLENDNDIKKMFKNSNPKLPQYFTQINEVIFDPELDININWHHIFIDRKRRIPDNLYDNKKDLENIIIKFRGNKENIKKLAKRNYKMVVPQYYDGKIQFLMPIYLGTDFNGRPDFVLVLDELKDGKGNKYYSGETILTVEMAYQNARLLAKPDNPWLIASVKEGETST
mgnify:CR=1 FL=1